MEFHIKDLVTVTFTLFAVIDVIGSVPVLISLKSKMGGINEVKATLISGALMILFLFIGEPFLNLLGLDVHSFAVGGLGNRPHATGISPFPDKPTVAGFWNIAAFDTGNPNLSWLAGNAIISA